MNRRRHGSSLSTWTYRSLVQLEPLKPCRNPSRVGSLQRVYLSESIQKRQRVVRAMDFVCLNQRRVLVGAPEKRNISQAVELTSRSHCSRPTGCHSHRPRYKAGPELHNGLYSDCFKLKRPTVSTSEKVVHRTIFGRRPARLLRRALNLFISIRTFDIRIAFWHPQI